MKLKPHDLIHIRGIVDLQSGQPFPAWVKEALLAAPWVVVRRATLYHDMIPVGIRGMQRCLRYAAWVPGENIGQIVHPADLIDPANWQVDYPSDLPPAIGTLRLITPILQATGLPWGPVGSSGFELATGFSAIKSTSDLDIVIESSEKINVAWATTLLEDLESVSLVRLDVQLETPSGGISLKEYSKARQVLIKTSSGPALRYASSLWSA
jgi:phosphoribosyl-dephospho-CoA transferase